MRTSHIRINKMINDNKKRITDEAFFSSKQFASYLNDIAEAASKRYKRKLSVKTYYDTKKEEIAYTDNNSIVINTGNSISRSFPGRPLTANSIVGLVAHEVGHVLFTNFKVLLMFQNSFVSGNMFPEEPKALSMLESLHLKEIRGYLGAKSRVKTGAMLTCLHSIFNIIEDIYIEARICDAFPGKFKTGIELNSWRMMENATSLENMMNKGYDGFSIMSNLILQYSRSGDFNNLGGTRTNEYIEMLGEITPILDDVLYDDDIRNRLMAVNTIFIKLWPYIDKLVKEAEEKDDGSTDVDELISALGESLKGHMPSGASAPKGSAVSASLGKNAKRLEFDKEERQESVSETQEAVDYETGRIALEKTDSISAGESGNTEYDNFYAGSGYKGAAEDINRLLNTIAEERVNIELEEELTGELREASKDIRHGNIHKGIKTVIHRITSVDSEMIEQYEAVSKPLLSLSKRMQTQVMQALKDKKDGEKLTGLLMGKRLNIRSVMGNDGRYFYNNRLPIDEAELAVGLLVDESGSMYSNDRITSARAASIVLQDFCEKLRIPACIYGHSTGSSYGVDFSLYAYSEFDSVDKKDRYRLMDISARNSNRDGAALRFVCERLMTRPEKVKLMIIISDGQPADSGYYGTEAEADLRGIKREYTNKGITIFAAAIGDDKPCIERIYGDGFLDITDVSSLPKNLTQLISRYIN